MWHEARKQERLIRGMIVDYRRRAERRKDFYEKIKAEPTQFLQLHGRPCKIHLDPAVAASGEGPAIMMPWQGDTSNMIDRFDVRAHLDFIPEVKNPDIPPEELNQEERQCNYERYRILAQNSFLGIGEDKFLQQLAMEEQFGVTLEEKEMQKEKLNEKKGMGAAIGYNYSDPGAQPSSSNGPESKKEEPKDSDDESDVEIIDVDLSIDVNKMEPTQAHELNAVGPLYGMAGVDLFSFLTGDANDAEHQKQLLREEKEKAMFSGRKSRRERRAHRDKKLASRVLDPPSYAAVSATVADASPTRSPSRSPSPEPVADTIEFITSFCNTEQEKVETPIPTYSEKLKRNLKRVETYSEILQKPSRSSERKPMVGPRRAESRSRSRSSSRSFSRNRSRSRSRSKSTSKSRSLSRSRSASYSRSRSNSRHRRSRSHSHNRSRRSRSLQNFGKRNRRNSRSGSFESNEKAVDKKPLPRYYGRRQEDRSSSELSLDSGSDSHDDDKHKSAVGNKTNTNQSQLRFSGSSSKARGLNTTISSPHPNNVDTSNDFPFAVGLKGPSRETLSLKEKLKRKMQAQLSRQLKADKRAEAARLERESRRQAARDEQMRELAIKLRRKQREMRHQQNRRSDDDTSDRSRSRSTSRESTTFDKKETSRSKSKSPPEKRMPVWEANKEPAVFKSRQMDSDGYHNMPRRRYEEPYREEKRSQDYPDRYRTDNRREYRHDDNRDYRRYDSQAEQSREYNDKRFNRYDNGRQDNRWEERGHSGRGRYFSRSNRGGYRSEVGPSWQPSRDYSPNRDSDQKKKVKLVDY